MALLSRKDLVVDYGSTHIKGALIESSPLGGRRLLRLESLPIVSISVGEDQSQIETYEYNVIRFVQSFFPEEENFILNLPLERVYVRDIKVPVVTQKQIDDVIPFEVEPLLPVSLDGAEVIGKPWEIGEESSNVITFTAQHKDLEKLVQPLLRGNSSIRMLSVDCIGLSGALDLLPVELRKEKLIGQIDIGGTHTILNFVKDGSLVFSRRIPIGGDDITEIVASQLNLEPALAEERKIELELDLAEDPEKTERSESYYRRNRIDKKILSKLNKQIKQVYKDLASEIDRSILSLPTSEEPAIFYVSGGGALMRGASEFLATQLDAAVERYPLYLTADERPIERFITAIGTLEKAQEKQNKRMDFLSTPFGMALRRSDFTLRAMSTPILFASISVIVLLLSFLIGILMDRRQIKAYDEQLALIARDIPDFKGTGDFVDEATKLCQSRLQYKKNQTGSVRVLDVMRDLTTRTPAPNETSFSLKSFTFNGKTVQFEAEMDNPNDVLKLKNSYASSPNYSKVEIVRNDTMPNRKIRVAIQLLLKDRASAADSGCR